VPAACTTRCTAETGAATLAAGAVRQLDALGWGNASTAYVNLSFDVWNWNYYTSPQGGCPPNPQRDRMIDFQRLV